jgi:hypothetical protein
MSELFIPPSELNAGPLSAANWARGIPTPGAPTFSPPVPRVDGIATCTDLISGSPPTLLEEYEIFSYSIGWAIYFVSAVGVAAPNLTAELALLVNGRVRYVTSQTLLAISVISDTNFLASGSWISDLVNAITLNGRERLTLRLGLMADQVATNIYGFVGTQAEIQAVSLEPAPFESTISYNTIQVAAGRRL